MDREYYAHIDKTGAVPRCETVREHLQKVSNYIFIITPENVDISGDFQDLLTSGGFDVASFN